MARFKLEAFRFWGGQVFEVLDGGSVESVTVGTEFNDSIGRHAPIFTVVFRTPVGPDDEEHLNLTPYANEVEQDNG